MDRLEELVYLTIGRAQMCWKEMSAGIPDDDRAHELGRQLIAALREHQEEAMKRERAAWLLGHPHIIRDGQGNIIAQSRSFSSTPLQGIEEKAQ